jgi:hypothetical protein
MGGGGWPGVNTQAKKNQRTKEQSRKTLRNPRRVGKTQVIKTRKDKDP